MKNGDTCSTKNSMHVGGMVYTNTAKNWIYMVNEGLRQSIHKYNLSSNTHQCIEYVHDNPWPDFGIDFFGDHLWFSYDGSRIFLANGLTLTSSDGNFDMTPHGDFNSSYRTYEYSYFSQSLNSPNVIAGIRSDQNHTVYFYSWPYLLPIQSKPVPFPPEGEVNGAEQVHICNQTGATYVVIRSTFAGSGTKIGVVSLD